MIPAHNEEKHIASTVRNLLTTPDPFDDKRVIVIADNCDDQTAHLAAHAGAEV